MGTTNALGAEMRAAIAAAASSPPTPDRKFNKDDKFIAYGLKTDAWRAIMRGFRPRIRELSLDERLALADTLFGEGEGWLGHSAIYVLGLSVRELGPRAFRPSRPHGGALHRLVARRRRLHLPVLQPLLLAHRGETLALLGQWNRSPNRWKRRASVVASCARSANRAGSRRMRYGCARNSCATPRTSCKKASAGRSRTSCAATPAACWIM